MSICMVCVCYCVDYDVWMCCGVCVVVRNCVCERCETISSNTGHRCGLILLTLLPPLLFLSLSALSFSLLSLPSSPLTPPRPRLPFPSSPPRCPIRWISVQFGRVLTRTTTVQLSMTLHRMYECLSVSCGIYRCIFKHVLGSNLSFSVTY